RSSDHPERSPTRRARTAPQGDIVGGRWPPAPDRSPERADDAPELLRVERSAPDERTVDAFRPRELPHRARADAAPVEDRDRSWVDVHRPERGAYRARR